jgi:putative NADPH-quinone reductase
MPNSICVIQGHPHAGAKHFCHALADAYAESALEADHTVSRFDIGAMEFPFLRDPADFATPAPEPIRQVQQAVLQARHLVVVYPLWLGTMPAVVKGRSARVIVTMGMPATAYRLMFGAHGVKGFESGILGMAGIGPIHETLIGGIGAEDDKEREKWLRAMRDHGKRGD